MKKRAEGIYSEDLKPGTVVFDKSKEGAPVLEAVFLVDGKEYETDSEGKIVTPEDEDQPTQAEFVNPMTPGVSYAQFLAAIPDGMEVAEYLAGHNLTTDEHSWILREIEDYRANQKVNL